MNKIKLLERVLEDYIALEKNWAIENRDEGKHFNSLRFFDIKETTHSFLLAY